MKTVRKVLEKSQVTYPLEKLCNPENILLLDIETTGFTAKSSSLYLIGCAYLKEDTWNLIQWFSEDLSTEKELLQCFFQFAKDYSYLIHFNGNNFDLPYLEQKCKLYDLPYNFNDFDGVDIYKRIAPYKNFLHLPNCKQKTMEAYLGIDRKDVFSGGELITVYYDYLKTPTNFGYQALILHNAEDLEGMTKILPMLAFADLLNELPKVSKVQVNYYKGFNGEVNAELLIKLKFVSSLPVSLTASANHCFFSGSKTDGMIKVPIFEEVMKYYYANYKDYYYLPTEDVSIHKSVACYVDKEHRTQASAATCYTKKAGCYLPEWDVLFSPFFKREYKSKEIFFELTENMKQNRSDFSIYAEHVLQMIASES